MSLLVLAYPEIPDSDFDAIQSIRKQYDRNYRMVDPHFTLVFDEATLTAEELSAHVKEIAKTTRAIKITVRGATMVYGPTEPTWFVLMVPDRGNSDIAALHYRLHTGILKSNRKWELPYIPHITVGHFAEITKALNQVRELNRSGIRIEGKIATLDVVSHKNGKIETVEKISLKK